VTTEYFSDPDEEDTRVPRVREIDDDGGDPVLGSSSK
jgi:hypothetical protein